MSMTLAGMYGWLVDCGGDTSEVTSAIRTIAKEMGGIGPMSEMCDWFLVVVASDDAAKAIKLLPCVRSVRELCEPSLYFFELKAELAARSEDYTSALAIVLSEHLLEPECELALNDKGGFWMWCSRSGADFVARCGEIVKVERWIDDERAA